MPITPNYGWATPVVSGDFGAWGGILNTAFVSVDADLKALANLVTANAANVAKTNLANSFSAAQTFTTVTASGTISATGDLLGGRVITTYSVAGNDSRSGIAAFSGGASQGADGQLRLDVVANPSPTVASRFMQIQSLDAGTLRILSLRGSQVYVGATASPSFIGAEVLRVEGSISAAGITSTGGNPITGSFVGSGASLTSIPESAVVNLVADLATLTSAAAAAQSTANTATTNANTALSTANTASTNASTAVSTANTANSTANTAQTQANTARSENILYSRLVKPGSATYINATTGAVASARGGGLGSPTLNTSLSGTYAGDLTAINTNFLTILVAFNSERALLHAIIDDLTTNGMLTNV